MQRIRRTPRNRRLRLAGLTAVGVLALAACGGDDDVADDPSTAQTGDPAIDKTPDDGIALLAAGAQEKVDLAPKYQVDQRATTVMDIDLALSGEGTDVTIGLRMQLAQRVAEVTEESSSVEATIDSIDVTDAPAGAEEQLLAEFDGVIGATIVTEYDENGQQVGEVTMKDGGELPASLAESFENSTQTAFPTEPVGIGSRWSSVATAESNGVELDVTTVYELTGIERGLYVISVAQEAPIDTEIEGSQAEGNVKGTGELRIDRENPLVVDMDYDQDVSMSVESTSIDMALKVTLDSE